MPKASGARTASVRKNVLLLALLALIIVAGVVAYVLGTVRDSKPAQKPWQAPEARESQTIPEGLEYQTVTVAVPSVSKTYELQVADTLEKQRLGLGIRESIGGEGMIFPYAKPQQLCYWMKDMKYSIDMIWLDASKRVVKLEPDVSPSTYPRTTFCQDEAQYVVELASGQAARDGVVVGMTMEFDLAAKSDPAQ